MILTRVKGTSLLTQWHKRLTSLGLVRHVIVFILLSLRPLKTPPQTFGDVFGSDGRPMGDMNITTISCDTTTNLCTIPVPAPSYALVFLTGDGLNEPGTAATTTFATTVETRTVNTVTVDQAMLATSNGGYGKKVGSTSPGSSKGAAMSERRAPEVMTVLALTAWLVAIQGTLA